MDADAAVRAQLLYLLDGGNAHLSFDEAVEAFPLDQVNAYPPNVPYTAWHVVEHMRICQWDILEYIRNPAHISPAWPEGTWPARDEMAGEAKWAKTLAGFRDDLQALRRMAEDETTDLYTGLPHAPQHNILREILVVADHNAYHIGELAVLRQVMGSWPAGRVGV